MATLTLIESATSVLFDICPESKRGNLVRKVAVGTIITDRPPHRSERALNGACGSYLECVTAKRSKGQG